MSFLDQKPFVVTADDMQAMWNGLPRGKAAHVHLRCALCGHRFSEGERARCIYTNSMPPELGISGNPFVCGSCDGPTDVVVGSLVEKAAMAKRAKEQFWFFIGSDDDR